MSLQGKIASFLHDDEMPRSPKQQRPPCKISGVNFPQPAFPPYEPKTQTHTPLTTTTTLQGEGEHKHQHSFSSRRQSSSSLSVTKTSLRRTQCVTSPKLTSQQGTKLVQIKRKKMKAHEAKVAQYITALATTEALLNDAETRCTNAEAKVIQYEQHLHPVEAFDKSNASESSIINQMRTSSVSTKYLSQAQEASSDSTKDLSQPQEVSEKSISEEQETSLRMLRYELAEMKTACESEVEKNEKSRQEFKDLTTQTAKKHKADMAKHVKKLVSTEAALKDAETQLTSVRTEQTREPDHDNNTAVEENKNEQNVELIAQLHAAAQAAKEHNAEIQKEVKKAHAEELMTIKKQHAEFMTKISRDHQEANTKASTYAQELEVLKLQLQQQQQHEKEKEKEATKRSAAGVKFAEDVDNISTTTNSAAALVWTSNKEPTTFANTASRFAKINHDNNKILTWNAPPFSSSILSIPASIRGGGGLLEQVVMDLMQNGKNQLTSGDFGTLYVAADKTRPKGGKLLGSGMTITRNYYACIYMRCGGEEEEEEEDGGDNHNHHHHEKMKLSDSPSACSPNSPKTSTPPTPLLVPLQVDETPGTIPFTAIRRIKVEQYARQAGGKAKIKERNYDALTQYVMMMMMMAKRGKEMEEERENLKNGKEKEEETAQDDDDDNDDIMIPIVRVRGNIIIPTKNHHHHRHRHQNTSTILSSLTNHRQPDEHHHDDLNDSSYSSVGTTTTKTTATVKGGGGGKRTRPAQIELDINSLNQNITTTNKTNGCNTTSTTTTTTTTNKSNHNHNTSTTSGDDGQKGMTTKTIEDDEEGGGKEEEDNIRTNNNKTKKEKKKKKKQQQLQQQQQPPPQQEQHQEQETHQHNNNNKRNPKYRCFRGVVTRVEIFDEKTPPIIELRGFEIKPQQ